VWIINNLWIKKPVNIVTNQYITPTLNTNLAMNVLDLAKRKLTRIYSLAGIL
jgi:dTDP-4-dehydrorhamnose reductase